MRRRPTSKKDAARIAANAMIYNELEHVFINNKDFLRLSSLINQFNPIRVMNMERMEIRHSAILAWLLDPYETHNLGDRFLRYFLAEAMRKEPDHDPLQQPTSTNRNINSIEILTADLSRAVVHREWRNIDILVVEESYDWFFVIENKINSGQHSDQLNKYLRDVKNNISLLTGTRERAGSTDIKKIQGIYLTLGGDDPENNEYVTMSHAKIADIMEPILLNQSSRIPRRVHDFIKYYTEILHDMTGSSDVQKEMQQLAKKLYKENRKVIDFIVENGSQTALDLALAQFSDDEEIKLKSTLVINGCQLVVEGLGKRYVSVIPVEWIEALGGPAFADPEQKDKYLWQGCENWRLPYPLGMWFEIQERPASKHFQVYIAAELGPLKDSEQRILLVDCLNKELDKAEFQKRGRKTWFTASARKDGAKYSRFYSENPMISEADDIPQIKDAIEKHWPHFEKIIDPVSKGLQAFSGNDEQQRSEPA